MQKGNYAIKALFVCDDKARITLLGWVMLSQSGSWHFSKFSSSYRHFAHGLNVIFIFLVHGFGFWWNENFENVKAKTRTKNDSPILKTTFSGVSQSNFVFRKLFLRTKTKKTKCEAKLTTPNVNFEICEPSVLCKRVVRTTKRNTFY